MFPIKSANGVDIHSLVLVPDAESTHTLAADWIAYVDDILVDDSNEPRISLNGAKGAAAEAADAQQTTASVTAASRNGTVVAADGQTLNNFLAEKNKALAVKVLPAPGFGCKGLRVRFGHKLAGPQKVGGQQMWQEAYIGDKQFNNGLCVIPAEYIVGEVEIEGDFISVK